MQPAASDEPEFFEQQILRESAEIDAEDAARARIAAATRLQVPTWSKLARQREKALLVEQEKAKAEIEAEKSWIKFR